MNEEKTLLSLSSINIDSVDTSKEWNILPKAVKIKTVAWHVFLANVQSLDCIFSSEFFWDTNKRGRTINKYNLGSRKIFP